MRTTVEITDEQRAQLLRWAAERGEKGFSRLVQEALDQYLATQAHQERERRVQRALSVLGSLDAEAAARMHQTVRDLRKTWRTLA